MTPIEELRVAYLTQREAEMMQSRLIVNMLATMEQSLVAAHNMIGELGDRLAKAEERISMIEAKGVQLDPQNMADEQLQLLGENMYERGALKETIANAVDYHLDSELDDRIGKYLENVDIEVELKDRNH